MENLQRAIDFAAFAHRDQKRKSTDIPYISHPFAVALLLQQNNAPEKVIIAGLLHDIVEDTAFMLDDIRDQFGPFVMAIVKECSEPDKTLAWEKRKQKFIDQIQSASFEAQWVACADKYHNLFTINRELALIGPNVWQRFNRGYPDQKWYYQATDRVLCTPLNMQRSALFVQYHNLVQTVFGHP